MNGYERMSQLAGISKTGLGSLDGMSEISVIRVTLRSDKLIPSSQRHAGRQVSKVTIARSSSGSKPETPRP